MISRRSFVNSVLATGAALAAPRIRAAEQTLRLRPGGDDSAFDPWIEVIGDHFRHNAREVSRLAGGRPILAVIKNNAYGLGDAIVGPRQRIIR